MKYHNLHALSRVPGFSKNHLKTQKEQPHKKLLSVNPLIQKSDDTIIKNPAAEPMQVYHKKRFTTHPVPMANAITKTR